MPAIPPALAFLFGPGEQPWTDLPDPGPTPNVTPVDGVISVGPDPYFVAEGEIVFGDEFALFTNFYYSDFTSYGTLWSESATSTPGITGQNYWNIIQNYGLMVSLAGGDSGPGAAGVRDLSAGVFQNFGDLIVVSDHGNTIGVSAFTHGIIGEPTVPFEFGSALGLTPFINAGRINVWNGDFDPAGYAAYGFLMRYGGHVVNSGELTVSGAMKAYGIWSNLRGFALENSGEIIVQTNGVNPSIGVYIQDVTPYQDAVVVNSGFISADVAIAGLNIHESPVDPAPLYFFPPIHIRNTETGVLEGDIDLTGSPDSLINAGTIRGDVFLNDFDDLVDNSTGIILGSIDLGSGNDRAILGNHSETIAGGVGIDAVSYANSGAAVSVNLQSNLTSGGAAQGDVISGFENIIGSKFDDSLIGNSGANVIEGGGGADTLNGAAGKDAVSYADSNTAVRVNLQTNAVSGGDAQGDVISGFEDIVGSSFNDSLSGDSGGNLISSGLGNDTVSGRAGADTLVGGGGKDAVSYIDSNAGVNVNLQSNSVSGGDAQGDVISEFEDVVGSNFSDALAGDSGNNTIWAEQGADTVSGAAGDDILHGGDGVDSLLGAAADDSLFGDGGDDMLFAGAGEDTLKGGIGNDMMIGGGDDDHLFGEAGLDTLEGGNGADAISGGAGDDTVIGGDGNDSLTGEAGRDSLVGGNDDDFLHGFGSHDSLFGGNGNDDVRGGFGKDLLNGSSGNDTLRGFEGDDRLFGGGGADTLLGNDGDDSLTGGGGVDRLKGDAGDDTLNGRFGDDLVTGGAGDDLFEFRQGHGNDTYDDFVAGGGTDDAIELIAFGADFDTFAEVIAAASDNGTHTTIDFGGGDSILLLNVVVADLHEDDFIFS